jgi:protein arginine N-methyltransferase 1
MCADIKRVEAYKSAIALMCKDKIVVDVGTGTGVLALAAAESGAKRVYAVE